MENKIIAIINGREVTENDYNALLGNLGQNAAYFQGAEGRNKLINELVMQELLYSDAIERNLQNDQEYIDVVNNMKDSMLKQYALRKLFNEITVSDDEVKEYYQKNANKYISDEMVKASHILVETEEKANEILKELTDGLSFEEAAKQYSSCPSKEAGGDLGQFGKGQMVPEFDEKVFSMKTGELSEPVRTQFGYHIIKVTDSIPSKTDSLEEVWEEVKKDCYLKKQEQAYINKQEELSKKYKVEIL